MAELQVGDRVIQLDDDGFLEDAEEWDEEIAQKLGPVLIYDGLKLMVHLRRVLDIP